MKTLLALLAATFLAMPSLSAGDAPPTIGDHSPSPVTAHEVKSRHEEWLRSLVKQHPELENVNLESPEGQEKLRKARLKDKEAAADFMKSFTERYDKVLVNRQAALHAKLKTAFGMASEEFDAIEPLLLRVENLRLQKGLVDNSDHTTGIGPSEILPSRSNSQINLPLMLGISLLDPTVQEIQDSHKALMVLVDGKPTNVTELTNAVARLRKARQGFDVVLAKAQQELRAVLVPKQEVILFDIGMLE